MAENKGVRAALVVKRQQFLELRQAGVKNSAIARQLGITMNTCARWAREHGLPPEHPPTFHRRNADQNLNS